QKAAEHIRLSRWGSDNLGLVVGGPTSAVDDDPDVAESKKSRRFGPEHRGAEDVAVERHRARNVADDEGVRRDEPELFTLAGWRHVDLLSRVRTRQLHLATAPSRLSRRRGLPPRPFERTVCQRLPLQAVRDCTPKPESGRMETSSPCSRCGHL